MAALLDDLYTMRYDRKSANCVHFAGEVWRRLTGDGRILQLAGLYAGGTLPAFKTFRRLVRGFQPTDRRARLALVLCEPPFDELHMGVLWERELLHLTPTGVECLELAVYDHIYRKMRFYTNAINLPRR